MEAEIKVLPKATDWLNWITFRAIHLVPILAIWTGVTGRAVALAIVLYWTRMFVITAGYHRYFAHRSFKTSRFVQFLIAFFGCMCVQKGPLWWAAHHRRHHQFADQPEDVHSPVQRGLWWAHVGWLGDAERGHTDLAVVKDLAKFRELHWLHHYHYLPPLLLTGLCYLIAGWSGVVIGMGASTLVFWHATFMVNSLAHVWGTKPYQTGDESRNNALIAFLTMGEGWHNNHHYDKSAARQGHHWWQIDLSYYLLWLLARCHIIWDLRPRRKFSTAGAPSLS